MTKFGKLLMQYGYTQSFLARKSGISQSNISLYTRFQETIDASSLLTRKKLANAFDLDLDNFEKMLDLKPSTILATNKQIINLGE